LADATDSRATRLTLALATIATTGPVLLDLVLAPRRVYSYLAADAFYYLTIGRNWERFGFPTFDHELATNGFHPLWQGVVAGLAHVFGDPALMYVSVVLGALLLGAAVWVLGRTIARAYGHLPPIYAALPLGVVPLLMAPLWWSLDAQELAEMNPYEGSAPLWCTLWMYCNGMETPLVLALWVGVLWSMVARPVLDEWRWGLALGVTMGLLCLARLDLVFVVMGLAAVVVLARPRPRALAAAALGGLVVLVPYVLLNESVFGAPVPVSGQLKSTFPEPRFAHNAENVVWLLTADPIDWWLERATRAVQLFLPPLVALHALLRTPFRWRRGRSSPAARFDAFLLGTSVGVIGLALYDGLFVPWGAQGHWYFPVSTVFVSVYAMRLWARRARPASLRGAAVTGGLAAAFALSLFLDLQRHEDHHAKYAVFCEEHAEAIRERFGPDTPMIEFDDGVVGYCTGMPTIPASGLGADPEAARRIHEGGLFPLAAERGHHLFTSSVISARVHHGVASGWPGGGRIVYGSVQEGVVVVEMLGVEMLGVEE